MAHALEGELFDFERELRQLDGGDDNETRLAVVVATALVKAVKAGRCYAPDHQVHADSRADLLWALGRYLERCGPLALQVSELSLTLQGEAVYTAEALSGSVPFLFYRDGVRELRFLPGIDDAELLELLTIARQCDDETDVHDDLVTRLWERELLHVDFIAVDTFLDESELMHIDTVADLRTHYPATPPAHQAEVEIADNALANLPPLTTDKSLYCLTTEELEVLQREVAVEIAPSSLYAAGDLLFDMLPLAPVPEVARAEVEVLRKVLWRMLAQHHYQPATALLLRVHAALLAQPPGSALRGPLRQVVDDVDAESWPQLLRARLHGAGDEMTTDLSALLALAPRVLLPAALRMLDAPESSPTRQVLQEVLLTIARHDPEHLARYLATPSLARQVTRLLGQTGSRHVLPLLDAAFDQHDPRVRREALQAAAHIGGTHAVRLLTRALSDADEQVRGAAICALGLSPREQALPALLPLARVPALLHKSPAEVRAVLESIGHCGGNEALKALRELAITYRLFHHGKIGIIRRTARAVLAVVDTPADDATRGNVFSPVLAWLRRDRSEVSHGR